MISIGFNLSNPFNKNYRLKNFRCKEFKVTKNKYLELQYCGVVGCLVELHFSCYPSGIDHAGVDLHLGFLTHTISINLYDRRNWDYENDCWEES